MERQIDDTDRGQEALPDELIAALKRADRGLPVVTARVDRELALLAERQFAGRADRPRVPRPARLAVAAAIVVAVLVVTPYGIDPGEGDRYADVDGSGRIDIADVLMLARSRGEVTQAELDAFARRIVSLDAGGERS